MSTEPRRTTPAPLDELMTIEEVAAYLKLPVATLRKWRATGGGPPAFRLGKWLRYRRSQVERFIRDQEEDEWR